VVIDLDIVERNARRMLARASAADVRLRPHVKTHKCVELAAIQLGRATGPITVSTLAEAHAFAAAGFSDVTWALPLPPGRAAEAMALSRSIELGVLVDHEDALRELSADAYVWLKVDCGYHRAGVDPESDSALELARRLAEHHRFAGLLTHAGHSYSAASRDEVVAIAREEVRSVVDFAARLEAEGIEVPEVSIGSTPTLSVDVDLTGVTEIRPGNYLLFDGFQAALGSCSLQDVAITVLGETIGSYADRAILDLGALALSKDAGATHRGAVGWGTVLDVDGSPIEARLVGLSQEHGKVEGHLPLGTRVRVIPHHSCLVTALHPRLYLCRQGVVVGEVTPVRGW
jgi:D-serine deaminase-like pyridoxal phosphate-dependent protein